MAYSFDNFIIKCKSIYPISDEVVIRLSQIFTVKEFKKNEIILAQQQTCSNLYFILNGLIRSYTIIEGTEVTSRLINEGHFITSFFNYYKQQASNETIEAYEDCTIAIVSYEGTNQLYKDFPEFNYVARVFTEKAFYQADEQALILRKTSAEMRVRYFLDNHSQLLTRVASRHIASFLGMDEATFSRTKSKLLKS